jgi:uncharacterized protein
MTAESQSIVNLSRANVLCERAVLARGPLRRMRGLLGQASLPAGEGILLTPAPSIHTAFMRFPIDVVFTDRELCVIKVVSGLVPWRTASARHARSALELSAGQCATRTIEVGDQLAIGAQQNGKAAKPEPDPEPAPQAAAATTSAPPRVLVIGADRRFRSMAATLLERRGLSVGVAERPSAITRLAELENADVVVLDASGSLTRAAQDAAELEALLPGVGVVVVAEQATSALSSMPVLAKWGDFSRLYEAVAQALHDRSVV